MLFLGGESNWKILKRKFMQHSKQGGKSCLISSILCIAFRLEKKSAS